MAEFCETCAEELGLIADDLPLFCEHCGEYFDDESFIDSIKKHSRNESADDILDIN